MLKRAGGFTLIELLVAIALGFGVIAAAVNLLSGSLQLHAHSLQQVRMNQDLRQLVNAIDADLRRAGGWAAAGAMVRVSQSCDLLASASSGSVSLQAVAPGSGAAVGVFTGLLGASTLTGREIRVRQRGADGVDRGQTLTITGVIDASRLAAQLGGTLSGLRLDAGSWTVDNPFAALAVTASCVVYGYDENRDGLRGAQERFGWRYDAADAAIEGVNNADACSGGDWQNLSDERVLRVTGFELALRAGPATTPPLRARRGLALGLRAQLRRDAQAERELRGFVVVRNDAITF